jgi:dUTP pyrophosphatase
MPIRTRGFEIVASEFRKHPDKDIILPKRGTNKSAGYDFYSPISFVLPPGQKTKFATDIKAYMLPDEVLYLYPRSSIGTKAVMVTNTVAIIDSDFYSNPENDGNIHVFLHNIGSDTLYVDAGDRIVQGIFDKYLLADGDTRRAGEERTGGHGHTGK